jgi:ectoine hydroxylase
MPRKDPVVHAAGADRRRGPLSEARLDLLESYGYLAFDSILSAEMLRQLQLRAEELRRVSGGQDDPEVVREPDSEVVRSIFAIHESDPYFARCIRDPGLVGLAEQILGGPAYVHQSRINYKPAFVGKEFYWHSDFETWHVEDGMPRMRAFSLSISLTENHPHNGPLMVIPGSHQHYVSCPGRTPEDHFRTSLRRQEVGVPPEPILTQLAEEGGIRTPTGPAGSAVLFDCNVMHGSNGNITPFARTNLFIVFNSVENALEAPFSDQAPRPEFIASRKPHPLG